MTSVDLALTACERGLTCTSTVCLNDLHVSLNASRAILLKRLREGASPYLFVAVMPNLELGPEFGRISTKIHWPVNLLDA